MVLTIKKKWITLYNQKRNKFIKNLASKLQGNTLCLFQYVEKHGKNLHYMKQYK